MHIEQSQDQDSASISKPFKSARGCGGRKRKGKAKQQQPQPPPPPPEQEEQYEDGNNYYHNENYRGNNRGHRPYRGQFNSRRPTEGLSKGEGDNKITIEANFKATTGNLILLLVAIIITMVIIEAETAVAMVVTFTGHMVTEEVIIEVIRIIHTINITSMMIGLSLSNTVHHVHFVEASIIFLNIVLRENMTLTISWRK